MDPRLPSHYFESHKRSVEWETWSDLFTSRCPFPPSLQFLSQPEPSHYSLVVVVVIIVLSLICYVLRVWLHRNERKMAPWRGWGKERNGLKQHFLTPRSSFQSSSFSPLDIHSIHFPVSLSLQQSSSFPSLLCFLLSSSHRFLMKHSKHSLFKCIKWGKMKREYRRLWSV